MRIKIGSKTFLATLEDNTTATAFKANLPLTVDMQELNGNEKLYRLPNKLPTKASDPGTIQSGDLMIYGATVSSMACQPTCRTIAFPSSR